MVTIIIKIMTEIIADKYWKCVYCEHLYVELSSEQKLQPMS